MRAMWTGVISFGPVVIPVKLGKATAEERVTMHLVHRKDGGRVQNVHRCITCGKDLEQADITRGAELATGETVMLSDAELSALPSAARKTIEVLHFCSAAEIDPVSQDAWYYLWPDGSVARKAYLLMYGALEQSGKVAVAHLALRQRESLAIVTPRNGALMLVTLRWPAEVREPDFVRDLETAPAPSAAEEKLAANLIEVASQAFNADEHQDEFSGAVRALVDGMRDVTPARGTGAAAAADLTETLKLAVSAARDARRATPRKTRAQRARKVAAS